MRKLFSCLVLSAFVLSCCVSPALAQKKKGTPEETFKKLDTNGDSKLSVEEFVGKKKGAAAEKAKAAFAKKDKDSDGSLTLEEFKGKAKKKAAK